MDTQKQSIEVDGETYLKIEWVRERILSIIDKINEGAYGYMLNDPDKIEKMYKKQLLPNLPLEGYSKYGKKLGRPVKPKKKK